MKNKIFKKTNTSNFSADINFLGQNIFKKEIKTFQYSNSPSTSQGHKCQYNKVEIFLKSP